MGYFVYVHINKVNEKKYVGITRQKPQRRWGCNGCNYKRHPYFWNSIQKYGWNNFDHQVFEVDTESEMFYLEQYLISYYGTSNSDKGYNLSKGGESGNYQGIGPEGYKKHFKEYVKDHIEERKEYQRQWYLKNQERIKEKSKLYRLDHQDKLKEYNKEYLKKWREENPDKLKAQQKRHRVNRKLKQNNSISI